MADRQHPTAEGESNRARGARPPVGALSTFRAYVALTKPRIIELLLITTLPVMFLAAQGLPPLWTVVATLFGGTLSAGSANALNCYIDRDIDARMRRTRKRPLATASVTPRDALIFGIVLGVVSTVWLVITVNVLAAGLTLAANLFYVFVYSMLLKRRTAQNIVWGGIAGCMPVLVGWAAVTGRLAWAPLVLFGVVFFWTPPHSWTLAMRFRDDYAAAEVPMLPVVAGERKVAIEIVLYTWAMVGCSLLLWPVAGTGLFYPLAAAVLGGCCLVEAHRLFGRVRAGITGPALKPMRFFHLSNTYLALLFAAVALDPLLH
ncbi:MAG: protoheme IX farnesyltransferase [Streptosporangiales bacterium]|nr:protoheme IX farnesyltransferase [Streptosporangiales bacterium]